MPKKASTTPVKPQRKTTPTAKAETDTKWEKLSGVKATPKKQKTPIRGTTETQSKTCSTNLTYSNDADKFPHGGFPIRLEHKEGNYNKTCWFQCENHFTKHITRYNITDYEAFTNDMALVGEVTGAKSKRVR